jgi:hypothetical protein
MKVVYNVVRGSGDEWVVVVEGRCGEPVLKSHDRLMVIEEARRIAKWSGPSSLRVYDDVGNVYP